MAEDNDPIILTFGGGIDARKSPLDTNPNDCVDGDNFDLDTQFNAFMRRKPFGLLGTAPNGEEIRGLAQLIKQDGTLSTLVQAGGVVYLWAGGSDFTQVGTVNPSAKLRGPIDSNFTLDEFIIIVDLAKLETVKQWDGTTFKDFEHNLGVNFFAKYVIIENERAIFWNVKTGDTDTPHIILASEVSDSSVLTVTDKPSTGMGADDPFFIPTPDLLPINGVVKAFGQIVFSTDLGRLWVLVHNASFTATDSAGILWSIEDLHAGTYAAGDEAMINSGNDVLIGVQGRIESLSGILEFGDVETNDLSIPIQPLIKTVSSWQLIYDRHLQRVICFPNNSTDIWTLHKSLLVNGKSLDPERSPWSKWATSNTSDFSPTAIGAFFDPGAGVPGGGAGGIISVLFGDFGGHIFQFNSQAAGDGEASSISYNPNASDGKESCVPIMISEFEPAPVIQGMILAGGASPAPTNPRELSPGAWTAFNGIQGVFWQPGQHSEVRATCSTTNPVSGPTQSATWVMMDFTDTGFSGASRVEIVLGQLWESSADVFDVYPGKFNDSISIRTRDSGDLLNSGLGSGDFDVSFTNNPADAPNGKPAGTVLSFSLTGHGGFKQLYIQFNQSAFCGSADRSKEVDIESIKVFATDCGR